MPISQTFLFQQENKKQFLKDRPFFIKDDKNHRNRLNPFLPKNGIKKHNQRAYK